MSRNERLFTIIESCMDELVDCFEELVKKSLFVVSMAVGTLVLMVICVIKVMTDRSAQRQISDPTTDNQVIVMPTIKFVDQSSQVSKRSSNESKCSCKSLPAPNKILICSVETNTSSVEDIPKSYPGYNDDFMKETKSCMNTIAHYRTKQTQVSDDLKEARIFNKLVSTTPPCLSKSSIYECSQDHGTTLRPRSKVEAVAGSCCSMCCEGDRTGQPTR